jgi:hypothetical protein
VIIVNELTLYQKGREKKERIKMTPTPPPPPDLHWWQQVSTIVVASGTIVGATISLYIWQFKRMIVKINHLERTTIPRKDHEKALEKIVDKIDDRFDQIHDAVSEAHKRVDKVYDHLINKGD